MKFRPTEFLNTLYRVSCYIKLYRKLFSCMRPIRAMGSEYMYGPYSVTQGWTKQLSGSVLMRQTRTIGLFVELLIPGFAVVALSWLQLG